MTELSQLSLYNQAIILFAALVREADRDRYLATLFAPAVHRDALFALYAFNAEITRVRELARASAFCLSPSAGVRPLTNESRTLFGFVGSAEVVAIPAGACGPSIGVSPSRVCIPGP